MTTGRDDFSYPLPEANCPIGIICFDNRVTGKITMNAVQIESAVCEGSYWVGGVKINLQKQDVAMRVCCQWHWEPDYPPAP